MEKIDVVITWVDGSSPELAAKRAEYAPEHSQMHEDMAAATRFASNGEIAWCVRSINAFAPWVNRIFIVTDGQDPQVQSAIPVQIIDHKEIFRGYEEYLPTFNSLAIEAMLWRIPGLSERFIYFNDDMFLLAPCRVEDFFHSGNPVCYGRVSFAAFDALNYIFKPRVNGHKPVTQRKSVLESMRITNHYGFVPFPEHAPKPLLVSVFRDFFATRDGALRRNASCRFRDASQFRMDTLQYLLLRDRGELVFRKASKVLFTFKPKGGMDYFERKFRMADSTPSLKFACFNSLDTASADVFKAVSEWMERRLSSI